MSIYRGSEIYAVELDDKRVQLKKEQLTTNVLENFLTFFQIISGDGYVATANSKGFFEDMDDKPIWTCQGASCNPLAEAISQAVAHRIPTKLHPKGGGKVKARAGCSGLPNTPLCTYHHSGVAQIAHQVWWRRRQDYIAHFCCNNKYQIFFGTPDLLWCTLPQMGGRRYQTYL